MGVIERKERDKERMKELILNAALRLFIELGYEKTSIRNIAEEIEYSSSTIYLYFKDKNDIFISLHSKAFNIFFQSLIKADNDATTSFDQLVLLGKNYMKFGLENPEIYELVFSIIKPTDDSEIREGIYKDGLMGFDFLKYQVIETQKDGYFPGYDPTATSATIYSYMHGCISLYTKKRFDMFKLNPEKTLNFLYQTFETFVRLAEASRLEMR